MNTIWRRMMILISNENEILMILQPRAIPEAIESLNKLDIEKVWFRGYTEMELEIVLNEFIKNTDYDYYWIIADDVVVDNQPLEVLRPKLYQGEVVTGYCNLYQGSNFVNLSLSRIPYLFQESEVHHHYQQIKHQGLHLEENVDDEYEEFCSRLIKNKDYDFWKHRLQELHLHPPYFMSQEQVDFMGDKYFQTYFAGWSFTGMSKEIWLKYPYQCSLKGGGTDAQFAMRFFEKEHEGKIFTHKDSGFFHIKDVNAAEGGFLKRNWLVGVEEPLVHFGEGKVSREEVDEKDIYLVNDYE